MDHELGSLEAGKRADVVVVDTSGPNWVTRSPDPALQLLWASDGRDVCHVVSSGEVVVRDPRSVRPVDLPALAAEAQARQVSILKEVGLDPRARWPLS